MSSSDFEIYIKDVLKQISFVPEHKNIRRELVSHFSDLQDEYLAQGVFETEISTRVIEDMGDPILLGKELHQIHHPLIGWLWYFSRVAVVVLAGYSLFLVGSKTYLHFVNNRFISDRGFDIEQFMHGKIDETNKVYRDLDLDIFVDLEDGKLLIDRFIQLEDGTVFILYQENHSLSLLDLNERLFDLRQYGKLIIDQESYVANKDGLLSYDKWHVLIYKQIPLEFEIVSLSYKQVSESFEKVLRHE